jgi:hypothetical protein
MTWLSNRVDEWRRWFDEPVEEADDDVAEGRGLLALNALAIPVVAVIALTGSPMVALVLPVQLVCVALVWSKLRELENGDLA